VSRRTRRSQLHSVPSAPDETLKLRLAAAETAAKAAVQRLDSVLDNSSQRVERIDRWVNYATGLGTFQDKTRHGYFEQPIRLTDVEITSLASGNHLAAKAIEKRPFEMFRRGYDLEPDGGEDVDKSDVEELRRFAIEDLQLDVRMRQGMVFGRQYGGSILLLGVNDGRYPWEPIDEDNIQSIEFVNQVDRRFSYVQSYYSDYMSPKYGDAQTYLVANAVATSTYRSIDNSFRMKKKLVLNPGENLSSAGGYSILNVHESRIIRFDGVEPDVITRQMLAGWSWSVLQRAYETLRQCDMGFDSLAYLISDANQGVMKLKGLLKKLGGPGGRQDVDRRLELIDQSRSVLRSIALDPDGGEDFQRVPTNFAGIPDAIDRLMQLLASAFDMPVTELFGISPAGLNATGLNDRIHWYDTIATDQEAILGPRLKRVYRLLSLAKKGPLGGKDLSWKVRFKPLHTPTDAEVADVRLKKAQTDQVYLETGTVTPEEVAPTLTENYPHLDIEAREEMTAKGKVFNPYPNQPPPLPPKGGPPDPTGGAGASGDVPEAQSPTVPLPGSALHTAVSPAGEGEGTPGDAGTGNPRLGPGKQVSPRDPRTRKNIPGNTNAARPNQGQPGTKSKAGKDDDDNKGDRLDATPHFVLVNGPNGPEHHLHPSKTSANAHAKRLKDEGNDPEVVSVAEYARRQARGVKIGPGVTTASVPDSELNDDKPENTTLGPFGQNKADAESSDPEEWIAETVANAVADALESLAGNKQRTDAWDESLHPRDERGRFGESGALANAASHTPEGKSAHGVSTMLHAAAAKIRSIPRIVGMAALKEIKGQIHEAKESLVGVKNFLTGQPVTHEQKNAIKKVAVGLAASLIAGHLTPLLHVGAAFVSHEAAGSIAENVAHFVTHTVLEKLADRGLKLDAGDLGILPENSVRLEVVHQKQPYSCGPAAVLSILKYWGVPGYDDEKALYQPLGTTPENGTEPELIANFLRSCGLVSEYQYGTPSIAEIEQAVDDRCPPIVDIQAYTSRKDVPWDETWDSGHYVIVLGYDEERFYVADPSTMSGEGFMWVPKTEFLSRWHDETVNGEKRSHEAIFVKGDKAIPSDLQGTRFAARMDLEGELGTGAVGAEKPVLTPEPSPSPVPLQEASVGILREGKRVLAVRATKGWRGHIWALPGGMIEANEAPEIALKRELLEEIGVVVLESRLVSRIVCPTDGRMVNVFEVVSWEGEPGADRDEIRSARWMMPVALLEGSGRWRKAIQTLMTQGVLGGKAENETGPLARQMRLSLETLSPDHSTNDPVKTVPTANTQGHSSLGLEGHPNVYGKDSDRKDAPSDWRYDATGWDLEDSVAVARVEAVVATRSDGKEAKAVFQQLLPDYPASALGWVLAAHWTRTMVPLADIDMSGRDTWTASKDGKIEKHKQLMERGESPPVILVQPPHNPKAIIVDGHHRTLATEALGRDAVDAYIANVHVEHGPWMELHSMQKRGSSKGSTSVSVTHWTEANAPTHAKTDAEWDESQHPRDEHGRFGEGSGTTAGKLTEQAFSSGGFTYRPGKSAPKDGYIVSLPKSEGFNHIVDIKDLATHATSLDALKKAVTAQVKAHLEKTLDHLAQNTDHYLGGYVEKDENNHPIALHLDVNEHHTDLDKAVAAGVARNQISIWDIAKGEEIKTGGTGR
jgi:uncharacterized protein